MKIRKHPLFLEWIFLSKKIYPYGDCFSDITNPDAISYSTDELKFTTLGGIRLEGLDRQRVTLRTEIVTRKFPHYMNNPEGAPREGLTREYERDNYDKEIGDDKDYDIKKGVTYLVNLDQNSSEEESASTLTHELAVHVDPNVQRVQNTENKVVDGTLKPGTDEYVAQLKQVQNSAGQDHANLGQGKIQPIKIYRPSLISLKTPNSTRSYIMKMLSQIKDSTIILYFTVVATCIILSCNRKQENVVAQLVTRKMPNGTTKVLGATINGKKQGLWIDYDDSGRVSSNYTYVNDSLQGEAIHYWADGTIASQGCIKNGQREGEWIEYYNYDKNKIAQKGSYKNGDKIGMWEYYIEDGRLNRKIEYTDTGKKVVLDNHLLPPVPPPGPVPITDSNNRVYVQ